MATNNVIHQLKNATQGSGENILLPRVYTPNSLVLTGATRAVGVNSLPADGIVFNLADESAMIPFRVGDDFDLDPATARLRLQFLGSRESGTSVTMRIESITAFYTTGASFAGSILAVSTAGIPSQTITEQLPSMYEFNMDNEVRAALNETTLDGQGLRALHIQFDTEAVTGAGRLGVYGEMTVMYGSVIVPASIDKR